MANTDNDVKFRITNARLYVLVVTLAAKDNVNFPKQLNDGFKRSIYWNEYKSENNNHNQNLLIPTRIKLDPSFQGVNRLFVLAFDTRNNHPTVDSHRRYFVARVDFKHYNVVINGRSFYDNPISSEIEQYDELRKVTLGKGDDYTTGCLLDFDYFKKHYKIIAVDLSKQKELDADPRAMQKIEFIGKLQQNANVNTILEKSKETIFEFYKGTVKVL